MQPEQRDNGADPGEGRHAVKTAGIAARRVLYPSDHRRADRAADIAERIDEREPGRRRRARRPPR